MIALRFIWRALAPFRLYLAGILGALCIAALDANLRPYLIKLLIDAATHTMELPLFLLVSAYAGCQLLVIGAWTFSDWCTVRYYAPFRIHLISLLTDQISHYSYRFFQNCLSGTIIAKMSDAFNLVPSLLFVTLYQFVNFTLTTVITLILLAQVHLFFAIGLLFGILFFMLLTFHGIQKIVPLSTHYAESKSNIWGYLSDYFSNILNVKCFSTEERESLLLSHVSKNFSQIAQNLGDFLMRFYLVMGGITFFYTVSFLSGLFYFHQKGQITPGDFALVFILNLRTIDKLYELSHQLRGFVTDWGTVKQALHILELPTEIRDIPGAQPLLVTRGEILFDQVQFAYQEAEPLFQNKTVIILPGQKIGLVGYSGSGKSTFMNLILRLFEVNSGRILIDGQNICTITQSSLRAAIGVIPQDPSLFHRSLLENIRYGRADASRAEVIEAAIKARADDFIQKFPQGYETLVGERGVKLSGGQRQRVAIARAILKNAPILILDEATSQLDSLTEQDIQDSLFDLMEGKTTIVIAHRLSTLLRMDRILVFDQGEIVQEGSHRELLAQKGLYKSLWNAQVGGFLPSLRVSPEEPSSAV